MGREQVLVFEGLYVGYGCLVGFISTLVVFRWLGPITSRWITTGYSELQEHKRMDWNDRMTSLFNAVISIGFSTYTLLYEDGMHEDKIWYDSHTARIACGLVIGYMLADVLVMTFWCKMARGEYIGYLFHHAATIYAYYFISSYGVLCYFGMLRLVAEMSTPFVDFRWFFDTLGIPRTKSIVLINGAMMVLTFLFFRMFTMPIYWFQIWRVTGTPPVMKLGHIMLIMYIPCLVLDGLNIYWFYKMCKGFVKAIKGLKKDGDKSKTA